MATLLIAAIGILSYTFLYAGSTASEEGVDSKGKKECSYTSTSVEDCDWQQRSAEGKKSCDGNKGWKAHCKGDGAASGECQKKCDWESKHGAKSEESTPEVEFH